MKVLGKSIETSKFKTLNIAIEASHPNWKRDAKQKEMQDELGKEGEKDYYAKQKRKQRISDIFDREDNNINNFLNNYIKKNFSEFYSNLDDVKIKYNPEESRSPFDRSNSVTKNNVKLQMEFGLKEFDSVEEANAYRSNYNKNIKPKLEYFINNILTKSINNIVKSNFNVIMTGKDTNTTKLWIK